MRRQLAIMGLIALAVLGAAPAANAAQPSAPSRVTAIGGVDDFTFDSFDGDYTIGRDGDGQSTLHVVETLVAVFPSYDQNRGIIRALVTGYDGHTTHLHVNSVTDQNGQKRDFSIGSDGDFTDVTIAVPEGQYVHGTQIYVIDYTQDNVTKFFSDTNDDEFYWDINGTGWAQPFGRVAATVHVDPAIQSALSGHNACYFGYSGETNPCELGSSGGTLSATVNDVGAYQNMTLAIGFAPHTFAAPKFNLLDFVPLTFLIGAVLLLAGVVLAFLLRFVFWRPRSGDPIVAQYEPPTGISVLLAADLIGKTSKGMAASIVDLAVRKKLRIVERSPAGGDTTFGVQQLDQSDLLQDEHGVMDALFMFGFSSFGAFSRLTAGGMTLPPGLQIIGMPQQQTADPTPSDVRWLVKRDTLLGSQVRGLQRQVEGEALAMGLTRSRPRFALGAVLLLSIVGVALIFATTFTGPDNGAGVAYGVVGVNAGIWITLGAAALVGGMRPLTKAGSKVWDQLQGLKLYIQLAEADRLQMLQSVSGAERITTSDHTQIVKIYERLLPYAVLFGLEKQWAGTLAQYYGDATPDWYDGTFTSFTGAAFATSLASLSSSVSSSSYSGSSGSSSSGGSGGGGSSGGGGGGGGGGGI